MSANKRKGTAWESAIVSYLRDKGFSYAERRALSGNLDKGDLTGVPGLVVEAKSVKSFDLSGWLNEAEKERDNAKADVGVVWIKRARYTSPGRAYVVMSGDDLVWLLKAAGYGPSTEAAA